LRLIAQVDNREVVTELGNFQASIRDKRALLNKFGVAMVDSIHHTILDEGSPSGSWPGLALSTLKKKGYSSGHKLLIMRGRLFGSIAFTTSGNTVTIGSLGIPYAAVQNYGSADRSGGSIGAQARIAERGVSVKGHRSSHDPKFLYDLRESVSDKGKAFKVPVRKLNDKRKMFDVAAHERFQNIPARPFMVFRPEDLDRLVLAANVYFAGKLAALGKVTTS